MKRSFLAAAALVAVFAFATTTASAQISFLLDDFTSASGLTSPNWSVTVQDNNGTATAAQLQLVQFRYDDPGPLTFGVQAPVVAPFASADARQLTGTIGNYTTRLVSKALPLGGSSQVLFTYDYSLGLLGINEFGSVEVFDGSVWNTLTANLVENDNVNNGTSTSEGPFDITTLVNGSNNARVRFSYNGADFSDWQMVVDNVHIFELAPIDVAAGSITAPFVSATNCLAGLSAAETVSFSYTNMGSAPINTGALIQADVDVDTVNILTEFINQVVPLAPGASNSYTTIGTVDLSALGAHTIDVTLTLAGDGAVGNNMTSSSFTLPGATPKAFGYTENFDSLPVGPFGNQLMGPVPIDWENAQDDAASLGGHPSPDWGVQNGTIGNNTANNDHTTLSTAGRFMWIEDSAGQSAPGDIELRSPCLDTAGAIGMPTMEFWYVSQPISGSVQDNPLDVDVIDVTSGSTVTLSVFTATLGGNIAWNKGSVNLSAFAGNLIKCQFRTNNDNSGNFQDDVSIDDFAFFDAISGSGQAPQPGNAVFDINNSLNGLGNGVASGQNGPYSANITASGQMNMTWSGQNNGIVLCLFGPPNDAIASFPGVGQLDIGLLPLNGFGVPGAIFIFGDGSPGAQFPFGPLFNSFFFTGPAGVGGVNLVVPGGFAPGPLTRFQCVMNPAGMFFISNAVDVTVL